MRCVVCHNIQGEVVGENYTQSRKRLIMYNKDHGTIIMNRHVAFEHFIVLKQYNTWWAISTTSIATHQTFKKQEKPSTTSIVDFFSFGIPYKKSNLTQ